MIRVVGIQNAPEITGTASLEVKTDPYLVYLSYGQVTKFAYHLEPPPGEWAWVEVKLLPPGVYDHNDPAAITVDTGLKSKGDYEVSWDGLDPADSSELVRQINDDGAHSFSILAITGSGHQTEVKSVINAYQ